jgi:hypothetical protein
LQHTEEEIDMRDQDVKELKEITKEIQKTLHGVDKTVSVHSAHFETLKNVKEVSDRSYESSKSAHHRIDKVEKDMEEGFEKIQVQQKDQFNEFKKLFEVSNASHEQNFEKMRAFGWKVFFLFATPFAVGLVGICWFVFKNGLLNLK